MAHHTGFPFAPSRRIYGALAQAVGGRATVPSSRPALLGVSNFLLTKLAGIFEIELQELFDFRHIGTPKELRASLSKFMNELDEQKLRLAVRLLKAVVQ